MMHRRGVASTRPDPSRTVSNRLKPAVPPRRGRWTWGVARAIGLARWSPDGRLMVAELEASVAGTPIASERIELRTRRRSDRWSISSSSASAGSTKHVSSTVGSPPGPSWKRLPSDLAQVIEMSAGSASLSRIQGGPSSTGTTRPLCSNPMRLSLLYFEGCPHWVDVDNLLVEIASELDGLTIERRIVDTPELAEVEQFRGSPTILIDGFDPFLDAADSPPTGLSCRLYDTPAGPAGSPTREQLLTAIAESRQRHQP